MISKIFGVKMFGFGVLLKKATSKQSVWRRQVDFKIPIMEFRRKDNINFFISNYF